MTNGTKNKVVTSVYQLNYITQRGGGGYKSFDLLTHTIRNIIFDDYEYVIYTDETSMNKFNLLEVFNQPNVTIKIRELNSEYYQNNILPYKIKMVDSGEIWDRIHSVDNYIEVILNKLEFLLLESKNFEGNVIWIDSGLFGTSCGNAWRDYMHKICYTPIFLEKIFEKIETHKFIALKGNHVLFNGLLKENLNSYFGIDTKIIPGALFGGNSTSVLNYLNEYKQVLSKVIEIHGSYSSEQELLYLLLHDKFVKFFEFGDWDDLQKSILEIMDLLDNNKYDKNTTYEYVKETLQDVKYDDWISLADIYGLDRGTLHEGHRYMETYEKIFSKYSEECPTIIEIGINDSRFPGACLKFWDKVFHKMKYIGLDITDCSHLVHNKEKITIWKGDQNNSEDLKEMIQKNHLTSSIDIVIDDGSHVSEHILTSFRTLYPEIKKGGLYIIEDLHASWAEREKTLPLIYDLLGNFGYETKNLLHNDKLLVIQK